MKRSLAAMGLTAVMNVALNFTFIDNSAAAEPVPMHDGHHAAHGSAVGQFAHEMDVGMARMMADMHAPGYSGNPDIDFLTMMIPHHQGAVEMARLVLIYGRDSVTRKLAEDIIAGQQVEIEGMRRRLEQLRRGESRNRPEGFPALGGTRGAASGK